MSYPPENPKPGYPPTGGYPSAPGAPYAPPPYEGYPPAAGGYPPAHSPSGYPPAGQPGYPPNQGYPPSQPQGYPHPHQGGPPPNQGYPGPGFAAAPGYGTAPGYQPVAQNYPPGGPYPPISHQPQPQPGPGQDPGGWMNIPQGQPLNCPPGLEYLTMIDQLLVHQKVELLEAIVGFETKNKFTIKNNLGQKVYYAKEDSDCCTRNCCGPMRPFDMKIMDNFQNEVIHLNRPLACDSCWFPCCLQSMEVSAPPGNLIGTVEQEWSICCPSFVIKNAAGEVVLKIDGPFCTWSICGDVEFNVMSADGQTVVGKISKQWSGLVREMFTDSDFFGITFPMDLDVRMKAVMLGACFLIDAMFFEKSGNKENDSVGMV